MSANISIVVKNLQKKVKNIQDNVFPKLAGNIAVKMFKDNFQNEGFFGKRWKEVLRRQNYTRQVMGKNGKMRNVQIKKAKGAKGLRKILSGDTANLGRSIQVLRIGKGEVEVGTDVYYGAFHNGGTQKLPQRQFIGQHEKLTNEITKRLEREIAKILGG